MKKSLCALAALTIVAPGCGGEVVAGIGQDLEQIPPVAFGQVAGLVKREIPAEDPGPPFYARLGVQFYVDDGVLAIPFYRPPECVPADFNILQFFHFPGPNGPGAFGCPLGVNGFLLTEHDAPLGRFPQKVEMRGDDVPIWFVDFDAFEAAAEDGVLTMGELEALSPLEGMAMSYAETLHPRAGEHKVIIRARGEAEGRGFRLVITDIENGARNVGLIWTSRGR